MTKVMTAHVPLDLAAKIDAAASRLDRSRGWIVKQALAAWVDHEAKRHQMMLEALADVDAERLINHASLQAWADSLGTETPVAAARMKVRWTRSASSDLVRLHAFLKPVAPEAAARVVQALARAPDRLLEYPRIGEKLDAYAPREVRRIIVGSYEMRYEISAGTIFILRIWHSREDRAADGA